MALSGKVVLITGGSSGIGRATVDVLLENDVKTIVIVDVQDIFEEENIKEKHANATVVLIKADVSSEEEIRDAFRKTIKAFHGVDIVIHSAGIFNDKNWRRQIEVNVNGAILVNMISFETMGKNKGGKGGIIINISSEAGYNAHPLIPIYAATKSTVLSLSRSFGTDLYFRNTGIKVITVCPSATLTAITPQTTENFIELEFVKEAGTNFSKSEYFQRPESVGKCVIEALIDEENGSIWLSKEDLPGKKLKFAVEPIVL